MTNAEKTAYEAKFFAAISSIWGSHGRMIECTTNNGTKFDIPIVISCNRVTDNSYHKIVNVSNTNIREKVITAINLDKFTSSTTIAHEFGHVLGLYDEYDAPWYEDMMFWHDDGSHHSDVNALMNSGSSMRDRYFDHYSDAVSETAPSGYTFKIK